MKQKGFAGVLVLVGVMVIVAAIGGIFYLGRFNNSKVSSSLPNISPTPSPSVKPSPSSPGPSSSQLVILVPSPSPSVKPSVTQEAANPAISIKYMPKSDWQTYTDEVAKFSFQYNPTPIGQYSSHQSLGKYQPGQNVMISGCNTPPKGLTSGYEVCLGLYEFLVYNNYDGGSRRDWYNKNFNIQPSCSLYYSDLSIAGKNALLVTNDCSSWGETSILIPNGSQMIFFTKSGYIRDDKTGKITLPDQIQETLSTFKFLN